MALRSRWKPDPLKKQGDFDEKLLSCGAIDTIEKILRLTRREKTALNYSSPLWQEIARQVKKRDCQRCRSCGGNKTLDVHHVIKIKFGGTNLPANLKTLCRKCHRVRHPEARKIKYVS